MSATPKTHSEKQAEEAPVWTQDSLFSVEAGYYPEATTKTNEECPACDDGRLYTDGGLFVCRACGFDSSEDGERDEPTDNPF